MFRNEIVNGQLRVLKRAGSFMSLIGTGAHSAEGMIQLQITDHRSQITDHTAAGVYITGRSHYIIIQ